MVGDDEDGGNDELSLINERLTEFPDLTRVTSLPKTVVLRQNMIVEIPALPDEIASRIEHLDLYINSIERISHLDNFTNLRVLDLSFNGVRKIEGLGNLHSLRDLFLVKNKITTIGPLHGLDSLVQLELGDNRIRCIENVNCLGKTLTSLWLGKNKIEAIENVSELTNLAVLDIQSNRLTSIGDGLATLTNLRELYLGHNAITSCDGLGTLINLVTLDISANRIERLTGIGRLKMLEELWANQNQLTDIDEVLSELRQLPQLQTVYLEWNPLCTTCDYKTIVPLALPNLQQLDAVPVPRLSTAAPKPI
ncbi:Protein phosphatase 1 regulatory subunit 7 [Plasmodiophora brassicae]